jgi:hypothetical protein
MELQQGEDGERRRTLKGAKGRELKGAEERELKDVEGRNLLPRPRRWRTAGRTSGRTSTRCDFGFIRLRLNFRCFRCTKGLFATTNMNCGWAFNYGRREYYYWLKYYSNSTISRLLNYCISVCVEIVVHVM